MGRSRPQPPTVDGVTSPEPPPRTPSRRWGLRIRAGAAMALGGLIVSLALGVLAYELSRSYLLDKRTDLIEQEAFLNARLANDLVGEDTTSLPTALGAISGADQPVLIRSGGEWLGSVVGVGPQVVPADMVETVEGGDPALVMTRVDGNPFAVVGVPLPENDRSFYQLFSLVELAATLDSIRNALVLAAVVTTLGSAAYGLVMSGRVLRPLRDTAAAAQRIASGDMSARLDDVGDPDLTALVESFNEMAAALEARIERERRFAADVSHELRTPLTALTSAVRIVERRSGELSAGGQEAVAVLQKQLDHFSRLVLEILDLSRLEAGIADVQTEIVDVRSVVFGLAADADLSADRVVLLGDLPERVAVDPRRLRVVVRNLVENAERYAGGCTRLSVAAGDGRWQVIVDDAGPGVSTAERDRIFERFHRGEAGTAPGAAKGTGLGLSLVTESVRAMGGEVSVTRSPDGGARFVVSLPIPSRADPVGTSPVGSADPTAEAHGEAHSDDLDPTSVDPDAGIHPAPVHSDAAALGSGTEETSP